MINFAHPPPHVGDPDMHNGTCRGVCRDRSLAVSFGVGGRENVPGIPGACATRNFTYLETGPYNSLRPGTASSSDTYVILEELKQ